MESIDLLVDLAFAMGAALLGGFVAHLLKQPVILGYLVAGVLVGPYTPGPTSSVERVETLANFGVALLMFALGTEFSLEALQRVRKVAVFGGAIQLALTITLGTVLGVAFGYSLPGSIFLGGIISISSSILMLKLLAAQGEVESIVGRVALGTSIVQDLATVAMIIILPALSGAVGVELVASAGLAMLQGGAFLAIAYVLGSRLVPALLAAVARLGSRELFLLTIVAIAVGMAVLGQVVGISFALGAFVGGIVVSESEFSQHVLDEITPVRDIFATLFFVSIGMLMNPAFLLSHGLEIALLVIAILAGKFAISSVVVALFGYSVPSAARIGLLLAQIGEFSFVLAGVGLARGAISDELYGIILAAALLTLALNPLLVNNTGLLVRFVGGLLRALTAMLRRGGSRPAGGQAAGAAEAYPYLQAQAAGSAGVFDGPVDLKNHVIICGYGRVGHELARALDHRGFGFVVIDYNPDRVGEARRDGYVAVQGDATNAPVLVRAGIMSARMVAAVLPDLLSAEQVIRVGKALNPKVRVFARTADARAIPHLKAAGANQVIQPEFEAGLELVRAALRTYGVSSMETQAILGGRRREHYEGRSDERDRPPRPYSDDSSWA
ncbi:MAG: cation:proton antiporter [Chloroflexota bacterium]|nr:cation:proton antiporter [Chloroflexota bacterium]